MPFIYLTLCTNLYSFSCLPTWEGSFVARRRWSSISVPCDTGPFRRCRSRACAGSRKQLVARAAATPVARWPPRLGPAGRATLLFGLRVPFGDADPEDELPRRFSQGCVSLPGQVGDRCNCEFWPSRVPTYPRSQLAARSAAIPTYPPSGAEFRERPPSGRAQRYLPTLARCLPAPRPYLPTLAQVFPIAANTARAERRRAARRGARR